jgi:hypothetical protein
MHRTDGKDPEDKVFMGRDEFGKIGSDPSIGAVLCGFDINISALAFLPRRTQLTGRLQEAC